MMKLNVLWVLDEISSLDYAKDGSLSLLFACNEKWNNYYCVVDKIDLLNGEPRVKCYRVVLKPDPRNFYTLSEEQDLPLEYFQIVMLRQDPPVDARFITACQICDIVSDKVLLVNNTRSIFRFNEKIMAQYFPDLMPPCIVSYNKGELLSFANKYKDVVFKPLDGFGGKGIFVCYENDANINAIIETLSDDGKRAIMAQQYLPNIYKSGDTRVFIVEGKVMPWGLKREIKGRENRANLAAGGISMPYKLDSKMQDMAKRVAKKCLEEDLFFVGLDIIDHKITEINITSITGMKTIDTQSDFYLSKYIIDALEKKYHNFKKNKN